MSQRTRRPRKQGLSLLEATVSLGVLSYGLLAMGGMQIQTLAAGAKGRQLVEAVEIARDQIELAQRLPWERVAPTGGFVPPPWIHLPGYAPGELPLELDLPGRPATVVEQTYSIEWRVADADGAGTLREIEVLVQWLEPPDRPRAYAISALRSR